MSNRIYTKDIKTREYNKLLLQYINKRNEKIIEQYGHKTVEEIKQELGYIPPCFGFYHLQEAKRIMGEEYDIWEATYERKLREKIEKDKQETGIDNTQKYFKTIVMKQTSCKKCGETIEQLYQGGLVYCYSCTIKQEEVYKNIIKKAIEELIEENKILQILGYNSEKFSIISFTQDNKYNSGRNQKNIKVIFTSNQYVPYNARNHTCPIDIHDILNNPEYAETLKNFSFTQKFIEERIEKKQFNLLLGIPQNTSFNLIREEVEKKNIDYIKSEIEKNILNHISNLINKIDFE